MNPITLPIAELKPALVGLGKVISSRTTLPVLKHVKIERTAEGWIALTSTDLDRFITVRLEHPANGPATAVLVPFEQLHHLSKNSGRNENLIVEPHQEGAVIKFALADKTGESKVKPVPLEEFPETPRIKADSIPLPPEFRRSIREAMECASTDQTRFVINSAFIDVSNTKAAYVVGTDGRHLYSANSFALPLKESVVIPSHKFFAWPEFHKDGEWQLKAHTEKVQINSRRWRIITKQIDGTYPNWRQVVPEPHTAKTHITIDPAHLDALAQIIQRLPCHEEQHQTMGLQWTQKQFLLLAKERPGDEWLKIPVSDVKGEGPEVAVFLDRRFILKALSYGLNTISIIDHMSPVRFSNSGKQLIVMPVRACPDEPAQQPKAAEVKAEMPRPEPPPPTPRKPMAPIIKPSPPDAPRPEQPTVSIKDTIEMALHLRDVLQDVREKLGGLVINLRHHQRQQNERIRDFDSLRSRLRSLQGLKL